MKRQRGQGITEYAIMLAVLLVIVLGVVRYIAKGVNTRMEHAAQQVTGQ